MCEALLHQAGITSRVVGISGSKSDLWYVGEENRQQVNESSVGVCKKLPFPSCGSPVTSQLVQFALMCLSPCAILGLFPKLIVAGHCGSSMKTGVLEKGLRV